MVKFSPVNNCKTTTITTPKTLQIKYNATTTLIVLAMIIIVMNISGFMMICTRTTRLCFVANSCRFATMMMMMQLNCIISMSMAYPANSRCQIQQND